MIKEDATIDDFMTQIKDKKPLLTKLADNWSDITVSLAGLKTWDEVYEHIEASFLKNNFAYLLETLYFNDKENMPSYLTFNSKKGKSPNQKERIGTLTIYEGLK